MRILGIDPGYDRLGLAVLDSDGRGGGKLVWSGCVKTSSKISHPERLAIIFNAVTETIKEHCPTLVVVEKLFFSVNVKTALMVAEARGAILSSAARAGLDIDEPSPQEVKLAVSGYGGSDKIGVEKMVRLLTPNLKKDALDDEIDAIAIGLAGIARAKLNTQKK